MTVGELKTILEDFSEDAEVRIMLQENYPLQSSVLGVWKTDLAKDEDEDEPIEETDAVWLVEGRQIGYGYKRAWSEVLV